MAMPTGGQPIDTLFVDLAVRTEKMQSDVNRALADMKNMIEKGIKQPLDEGEKKVLSFGQVFTAALSRVIETTAISKNPLAGLATGLSTVANGIQAAAGQGAAWATGLVGLLPIIGAVITALGLMAAGLQKAIVFMQQAGAEGVQLAARLQTLQEGLAVTAKNAGLNVEGVRQKVQDLQKTGIVTAEAIESLMQFMTQKLPIENIEKLARTGQDMAVAFGRNSTEVFNRFVYAIISGNTEVLRMIGINTTAVQMQDKFAQSIGKTREELTELQRKEAIMQGIMAAGVQYTGLYEKSMETLGKRIGSLPRYIEEGKTAFGQVLLPVLDLTVTATEKFWKSFRQLFVVIKDGAAVVDSEGNPKFTKLGQLIHDIAQGIEDKLLPFVVDLIKGMVEWADRGSEIASTFKPVIDMFVNFGKVISDAATTLDTLFGLSPLSVIFKLGKFSDAFKTAFTTATQIVQLTIAVIVGMSQALADLFENVDRFVHGKALRSLDELDQRMQAAARNALLQLTGLAPEEAAAVEGPKAELGSYPVETGPFSTQEAVKSAQDAMDKIDDIMSNAAEARTKAFEASVEATKKTNDEYLKALIKNSEELGKALTKLHEQEAKARVKIEEATNEALAELQKQVDEARLDEQKNFQDRTEKEKADFLFAMKRMEEDYHLALEDAVGQRDAKAILRLMKQYQVQKSRAQEDFDRRQGDNREEEQRRLSELDKREADARERIEKSRQKQLDNLKENVAEQEAALDEAYRKQQTTLTEAYTKQLKAIQDGYQSQLDSINKGQTEQLKSLAKALADSGVLTKNELAAVLKMYDATYGLGGNIDTMLDEFDKRISKKKALTKLMDAIKGVAAYFERIYGAAGPSTGEGGGEEEPVPAPAPGRGGVRPRQMGGVDIVTQPTRMLFGEKDKEAVISIPMTSGHRSLEQFFQNAGAGTQTAELNVHVTADSNFSPEFEGRLYDTIAQAALRAAPHTRVRRR